MYFRQEKACYKKYGGEILFFRQEKAFYKKSRREILYFRRKKAIYKKSRREILFFRQEKAIYKKSSKKVRDSAGQETPSFMKIVPLPGVKFILSHCFQLFSISSLIISTYLRALEMSWLMVYTSLCVISSLQPFAALNVFLRLWRSPSSSSSVPTPR